MSHRHALLISNSTLHGSGYLEHCRDAITQFLGEKPRKVLFFPFALADHEGYAQKARTAFESFGHSLTSAHEANDKKKAVENAEAIFIGGGNTFRLLKALYDNDVIETIRKRVLEDGVPYIGTSAGSNVACCTIKTTNDMPIVFPPSFDALQIVPFNINAHYIEPVEGSTHMGETREERIRQFHEENDKPVVGLPEGAMLRCEGETITLQGGSGVLFAQGKEKQNLEQGADLSFLLQ